MKQVFVAQHSTEAHFVKDLLEAQGIAAVVRGEELFGIRGEIPPWEAYTSVWITDEALFEKAREVVLTYSSGQRPVEAQGTPWQCTKCGQQLEPQFTECWRCGTGRPAKL